MSAYGANEMAIDTSGPRGVQRADRRDPTACVTDRACPGVGGAVGLDKLSAAPVARMLGGGQHTIFPKTGDATRFSRRGRRLDTSP